MVGWEEIKLKDITEIINRGITPKYVNENGYVIINQKCIRDNVLSYAEARLTDKNKKLSEAKKVKVGDVLVNSTGTGTLGRTAYVKEISSITTVDSHVTIVRGNTLVDKRFLAFNLGFQEPKIELYGKGATNQIELNRTDLGLLKVQIPSIPTQSKIAKILSAYDDLIENNKRRIKLLEEMAQMTYEEWFVRMKFPGHEKTSLNIETGLPKGWRKVQLGEEIKVARGSSPRPIADQIYFEGGTIPWLKIADATASHIYIYRTKEYVNDFGASFSRKLPPGSLIVAASGTLGFPMFLGVEACIHDGWIYFEGIKESMKEYFYFSFIYLKKYFESISYGAAIQNINTGIVKGSPLTLPSTEVLNLFHQYAKLIFDNIKNLQLQNIHLKEARDILLPRLMTGMIDVEKIDQKIIKAYK